LKNLKTFVNIVTCFSVFPETKFVKVCLTVNYIFLIFVSIRLSNKKDLHFVRYISTKKNLMRYILFRLFIELLKMKHFFLKDIVVDEDDSPGKWKENIKFSFDRLLTFRLLTFRSIADISIADILLVCKSQIARIHLNVLQILIFW
jgi:hypothetical protein